jgi:hypothetical protein
MRYLNITGSNIDAQQQLSLNSAKDINIKAGYDGSLNESYHKTSGLSLGAWMSTPAALMLLLALRVMLLPLSVELTAVFFFFPS